MMRSMTGFGRERMMLNGRDILVEVRSVNHRYNELSVKLSRAYMYLEEPLKKLVQDNISRGKTVFCCARFSEALRRLPALRVQY